MVVAVALAVVVAVARAAVSLVVAMRLSLVCYAEIMHSDWLKVVM